MVETCRISRDRASIKILPLAVDTRRFAPAGDRSAVRKLLGIPQDREVMLTVRRLVGRMGLNDLIDAMQMVVQRHPRAVLLIGGTGYLEQALKERVRLKGLEDHVRLLGFVPEEQLPAYYQAADLFVLPTVQMEGFGLVTIEALSCGTPVIATPVGANPEVVGPLDSGLLCERATADGLAERIAWWLERGVSADLRQACREYSLSRFAVAGVTTRLEQIFSQVVRLADVS
jgi:glycosyltransferase involved in cell wall biosynthesis